MSIRDYAIAKPKVYVIRFDSKKGYKGYKHTLIKDMYIFIVDGIDELRQKVEDTLELPMKHLVEEFTIHWDAVEIDRLQAIEIVHRVSNNDFGFLPIEVSAEYGNGYQLLKPSIEDQEYEQE